MTYNTPHRLLLILFVGVLLFYSCQSDSDGDDEINMLEEEFTISEKTIIKGDPVISDILKIVTINGGKDDVLDGLPQSQITLPVSISMNGQSFTIDNDNDIALAKVVADYNVQDDDKVTFVYPINLRLNDFTERIVHNEETFLAIKNEYQNKPNYNGIDGAQLKYPISIILFNTVSREGGAFLMKNDEDMARLMGNLLDSDILEIKFPIEMQSDFENTVINITSKRQLSNEINAINDQYLAQQDEEPTGIIKVCHNVSNNPKDLDLNINALPAHLGHGDIIGGCNSN